MASTTAPGLRARLAWAAFALSLLVQLAVLYAPSTPDGTPDFPGADKLAHAAVFLLPAMLGVLARIRPLWLGIALVAHAVASELVQHLLLPQRTGDAWDAVADVIGVGLGLAIGVALRRRASAARRAPR